MDSWALYKWSTQPLQFDVAVFSFFCFPFLRSARWSLLLIPSIRPWVNHPPNFMMLFLAATTISLVKSRGSVLPTLSQSPWFPLSYLLTTNARNWLGVARAWFDSTWVRDTHESSSLFNHSVSHIVAFRPFERLLDGFKMSSFARYILILWDSSVSLLSHRVSLAHWLRSRTALLKMNLKFHSYLRPLTTTYSFALRLWESSSLWDTPGYRNFHGTGFSQLRANK